MTSMLRTVQNNLLTSEKSPIIRIRIDPNFNYVGGLDFILNDTTLVEQHHFIQSSEQQIVQRHLWFQFEGFLENNTNRYRVEHRSDLLVLGAFEFLHDTDLFNWDVACRERPNSDSANVVEFLSSKGYRLRGDSIFKRLVWLDQEKRNELMIIFSEDLGLAGYQVSDQIEDDVTVGQWPDLIQELHDRALTSFSIVQSRSSFNPPHPSVD